MWQQARAFTACPLPSHLPPYQQQQQPCRCGEAMVVSASVSSGMCAKVLSMLHACLHACRKEAAGRPVRVVASASSSRSSSCEVPLTSSSNSSQCDGSSCQQWQQQQQLKQD